jgi:hypothetical protein
LNSTSLLYMTIFFLQQLQWLPALQQLVPPELLEDQQARLLQVTDTACMTCCILGCCTRQVSPCLSVTACL